MANKISENLSSNTLYHFTPTLDNLLGILTNNFQPKYCLETTDYLSDTNLNHFDLAFPMICFCDIPLSKIKKHIGDYGDYGIGMTKNWGYQNNLSPILYATPESRTSANLAKMIKWYIENTSEEESDNNRKLNRIISDFMMFTKPYEGKFTKQGKKHDKRFYDEREWRWIPEIDHQEVYIHLQKEQYENREFRNMANNLLARNYRLHFTPDDIKYLIIKNENEIDSFIQRIERIKSGFDNITVKRLSSRILTKEQILYDF